MVAGGEGINIGSIFGDFLPKKKKHRKMKLKDARQALLNEESEKLIDLESVNEEANSNYKYAKYTKCNNKAYNQ